jgi:hypothetical protein
METLEIKIWHGVSVDVGKYSQAVLNRVFWELVILNKRKEKPEPPSLNFSILL